MVPLINEVFGWIWITGGMATGVWLGLRFRDERWLGGYSSWARRMVRLGHIAMIMLGVLNVLFASSAARLGLGEMWMWVASVGWIAGGVLMPSVCFLSALRQRFAVLFALPVVALLGASALTVIGFMMTLLAGTGGGS